MTGSMVLRARGLTRQYGRDSGLVRAVDEVDLDVPAGQVLAVMGPSGCGKSTLLHLLGGLQRPTDGQVWLAGCRIDTMSERALARLRRHRIGFVFQSFHLMDELTAVENVELAALLAGQPPRRARRRALHLLDRVGLADRATHLPSALSGGQRQRVAIARALSNDPLVVLADEPTGNLDSAATLDVLRLFEELRVAGHTLVVVTHDASTPGNRWPSPGRSAPRPDRPARAWPWRSCSPRYPASPPGSRSASGCTWLSAAARSGTRPPPGCSPRHSQSCSPSPCSPPSPPWPPRGARSRTPSSPHRPDSRQRRTAAHGATAEWKRRASRQLHLAHQLQELAHGSAADLALTGACRVTPCKPLFRTVEIWARPVLPMSGSGQEPGPTAGRATRVSLRISGAGTAGQR
ncbi:ABC transporter ATP-binding protein [Micromonospora deserti]|uniref:ABC transporter ATP-binding protein n=1 Tax=Micromonospora deserti TaxID=2070366 RepID=UPI001F31628B|nr:ABC transporter ATP-binding protein [Micromonospora deserti]